MNPFLRVIEALNQHDVRYVVVGGFAGVLHGNHRATADLDLVVDLGPEQARRTIEALVSIGMKSRVPVDPFLFADATHRERWVREKQLMVFTMYDPAASVPDVDLFVEHPVEFDGLCARAEVLTLVGQAVPICSLTDLIDMKKRTGRPQDELDVQNLEMLRNRRPNGDTAS